MVHDREVESVLLTVPLLAASATEAAPVGHAVWERPDVKLIRVPNADAWGALVVEVGVGVLGVEGIMSEEIRKLVVTIATARSEAPPLLVCVAGPLPPSSQQVERIENLGLRLVVLPAERSMLRYFLARAAIRSTAQRLTAHVEGVSRLPHELRRALLKILSQRCPAPNGDGPRPLRHLNKLAAALNASRKTIWDRAHEAGVPVVHLLRIWLGTQAVILKAVEGPKLQMLARRFGYKSHSGLIGLAATAAGTSPGAWPQTPAPAMLERCVDTWASALEAASNEGPRG
jgi:hypothetical protein